MNVKITAGSASTDPASTKNTGSDTSPIIIPTSTKKIRRGTKIYRVTSGLMVRSYNRFEAERLLHDHALHSTVSDIQRYGIRVDRRMEVVPGYQGAPTHVCRYWISTDQHERACQVLGVSSVDQLKFREVA